MWRAWIRQDLQTLPYQRAASGPIGCKDTVDVNFSRKTLKVIGALCDGKFHYQFQDSANSDNLILMLERLRELYGKVFVILDNARAHKSKKVQEYLNRTNGDVVLWYLPPHSPQHNPIEVQWREIKRAITYRFFKGGLKEMQGAIRQLLGRGEVPVVRLLNYMIDAITA